MDASRGLLDHPQNGSADGATQKTPTPMMSEQKITHKRERVILSFRFVVMEPQV